MRRTVPPSAEIEGQIDRLLSVGVGENPRESLSELARLGARLIIQRAVEDEFDAWLGRARRTPQAVVMEALLSIPTTAHILGGAVIDATHRPAWSTATTACSTTRTCSSGTGLPPRRTSA